MTADATKQQSQPAAIRIRLRGHVQGVGMRPAIARLAARLGIAGSVSNDSHGVIIHAEGPLQRVDQFADQLIAAVPAASNVESVRLDTVAPGNYQRFRIDLADQRSQQGQPGAVDQNSSDKLSTRVPFDIAVCAECLAEINDPDNRRSGYAFTSCTNCGPRYSVLRAMPYERFDTSMDPFEFCATCAAEYEQPTERRFHAQTNACPKCGPKITGATYRGELATDAQAIQLAVEVLRRGKIVAVKGIGGYQLLCDAANDHAVSELRRRKRRRAKPLPIMVAELPEGISKAERQTLCSPANPIVVVYAMYNLSPNVHPGLNSIGVMLPTTPLHALLLREHQSPLVVTSGNLEGEPLDYKNDVAEEGLADVADYFLHHDREVVRPIDDSVVRVIADRAVTFRAARGIAPLPLQLDCEKQILAVGGQQKVAIALSNGAQCALGPHVGDLSGLETRERFVRHTQQFCELFHCRPELIVCDQHPDYFSARWAQQQSTPVLPVQHHHAHIAAGMLEHDWLGRTVLGIAADGTGYGPDGTIWGGEFLLSTARDFRRVGTFRSFLLPGGEMAIRQPWRVALALLHDGIKDEECDCFSDLVDASDLQGAKQLIASGVGAMTTSLGRIFDAVAAMVLGITEAGYEGEPAAQLEAVCNLAVRDEYVFAIGEQDELTVIDWRPLINEVAADIRRGTPASVIAMRFHRTIAAAMAMIASRFPGFPVVLGGGCFQNKILTELVLDKLKEHPMPLGPPGRIPPNDGGLAAGQLAIAIAKLKSAKHKGTV